jgi:hypothetical protein
MYSKIVTIFNYYESATTGEAYWYPHVLSGVDLITDKGAILKKYGPDATDNAQLHIRYAVQNSDITIADKDGKILPWVPPKEWQKQTNDLLPETLTFSPEDDFFWEGEWDKGIVNDTDFPGGFYQYMNQNRDNVFKITSVGGPYNLIPHFEILAK